MQVFFGEGKRLAIGNVHLQAAAGGPQLGRQVEAHVGDEGQHVGRCESLGLRFLHLNHGR